MSSDLELVHLQDYEPVSDDCLRSLPESIIRKQLIVPISRRDGRLIAAVPQTTGIVKPEGLQMMAHCPVDLVLAPVEEIISFIRSHYPEAARSGTSNIPLPPPVEAAALPPARGAAPVEEEDLEGALPIRDDSPEEGAGGSEAESAAEDLMESGRVREPEEPAGDEQRPLLTVIHPEPEPARLSTAAVAATPPSRSPEKPIVIDEVPGCPLPMRKLLSEAAANRAREILLERDGSRLRLRQRIRGVLVTDLQLKLSADEAGEVFRYVAENGDAQSEGGVRWAEMQVDASLQGESHGCRFALSETKAFAMLTVRLTPIRERAFDPVAWGMGPLQARTLESFLGRRQGVILFCGFEGDDLAGTTHACLRQLVTPERHVIAVQGRRDERLPGVEQLVSFGDRDLFSKHLQVAFRHGPDVVLANPLERRDHFETCLNEALQGRLVLAGSHAADAADAIVQVFTMGVEPYLVGSSLLGVVAQRTLRLNCQRCQDKDAVDREHVKDLGIPVAMQPASFFRGRGCDACLGTGFDRETSIFEVLEFNEEARARIQGDARAENVRALLRANGMMTLRQIAVHKAINGQTSLAEVLRATA